MWRVVCMVAILVCGAACGTGDLNYPPPPQRTPAAHTIRAVLRMGSGESGADWGWIAGDVLPAAPGLDWRWTRAHPFFEFVLKDFDGWKVVAHVTAVDKVLAATGPQRVAASVNGTPVGSAILSRAGGYDLTFPVTAEVLKKASPAALHFDIDPCLVSDSPHEKGLAFCVLLHSVGFVRTAQ